MYKVTKEENIFQHGYVRSIMARNAIVFDYELSDPMTITAKFVIDGNKCFKIFIWHTIRDATQ